ncbi:SRPBCC domain-containing protein [Gottfriedia acidiceleris]|uniref:SRPBCC domain-containing protein n=1 Tax=Gottfriedia acidiceleris TaxID=371036 RepID=UPI00101D6190|nr:SRPBCC domain-containing protein [Gottfriedia acidiceleris]
MNNVTKFNIFKPAKDIFEAFVDPTKIGNFWFSSSSERWEEGKVITLKYDLYNAEGKIKIIEVEENKKIVFAWGPTEEGNIVTITLNEQDQNNTIIEVVEEGFSESNPEYVHHLIDNKEGWVFMLSCLKCYLEFGVTKLRGGLVK